MADIILEKPYATIEEHPRLTEDESRVRIYKADPESWNFQIRTFKPINHDSGKGKQRHMIATVRLTLSEMKDIVAKMEEYENTPKAYM